jgi:hypothetical protein
VSTILKALRETEAGKEPAAALPVAVDEARRRRRNLLAIGVGAVTACLIGSAVFFSRTTSRDLAARPETIAAPPQGLPPAAPVPAPPVAHVEPPRARVADRPTAGVAPTPPVATRSPAPVPRSYSAAPGGPAIEVASIQYSPGGGSTVTLSVGGAAPVTLRQGDTVDGLEVQLIVQGSVYLRHGGNVFAIDAPR